MKKTAKADDFSRRVDEMTKFLEKALKRKPKCSEVFRCIVLKRGTDFFGNERTASFLEETW